MLGGAVVIFLASLVFPNGDLSFGLVLFPFLLYVIGGIMVFKGFNSSPIEHLVRGGADKGIKHVRENWFRTAIDMFLGTKRKWYRATFFLPLLFLIVTMGMFSSGVISFTFFPNIQPDFFSIEAAYRPGDSKEQTERFVEAATKVLLEENERIQAENGDTLLTYFSSNIGFSQNLGQN